METNIRFETMISHIKFDNKEDLKNLSLLEYVQLHLEADMYFFFIADTDAEVEKLNHAFMKYIVKNYNV